MDFWKLKKKFKNCFLGDIHNALHKILDTTVIVVSSAKEALEVLKNNSIDVIISDIVMPEMDGFEFAKIVKKNYPDIIFIFLSAFFDTDTLSRLQP